MPGEVAPAHRHTPSALRFIMDGDGTAYTAVNGEKVYMRPGDMVLTPSMQWHDHGHEGEEPIVWLDVWISLISVILEQFSLICIRKRYAQNSGLPAYQNRNLALG